MSYIILCNTGSDMLSRIDTQSLKVEDFILFSNGNRIGPHEITLYKNSIRTALFLLSINHNLKRMAVIKKKKIIMGKT